MKTMILPSSKIVGIGELILPDGHFTWSEATKGGTRVPKDARIEARMIDAAKMMEWVRYELGSYPLYVTSWYRPRKINQLVGGASNSRHLYGDAVDFGCKYLSPEQIYRILDKNWVKGGLSRYTRFVHIDCRGYKVRW